MPKAKKILRYVATGLLCVCTVYLVYTIIVNPLETQNLMLALATAAGFIALGSSKNADGK